MPDLTNDQLTLALAGIGAVALLAFLLCLFLMARLWRVRRDYAVLRGDGGNRDVIAIVGDAMNKVENVHRDFDEVARAQEDLAVVGRLALQRFALVRYDAFEDMGGQLSFSAALLDDHGDGLVVTSINGRTETRTYAKIVRNLKSPHNLSEEEIEAIGQAASGHGRGSSQPESARSR